jgi:two-component system KDP operon response regulator KdpE
MRSHLQPATKTDSLSGGSLLIVDYDDSIRWALRETLTNLRFEVSEATSGEQAIALIRTVRFDAVLLESRMPGMNGLEACRKIRELAPRLAIVVLTARHSDAEKLELLGAGADDYIIKPFEAQELAGSIRAAIVRSQSGEADIASTIEPMLIQIADISLDAARRLVRKAGEPVTLTAKEFDLLYCLMTNSGSFLTHTRLLDAVWGPGYSREVLRTYVRRLRKKLGDNASRPRYLLTDSGGYRFSTDH